MALLATGFHILFFEHRPQPELVQAMCFQFAGRRATIAPVAARAAKAIRFMNLEQLFIRMAGERSEEHTSELQSRLHLVCRLLLEKKKKSHTYIEGLFQDTQCTR